MGYIIRFANILSALPVLVEGRRKLSWVDTVERQPRQLPAT